VNRRNVPVALLMSAALLSGCGGSTPDPAADTKARVDAAAKEKAREASVAAREAQRLADLWSYSNTAVPQGHQLAATISSSNDVDADGQGGRLVQLVFRDHSSWGKSSYLVLKSGDFNCYAGCTVRVKADDAPPKAMAGRRPKTDEAIAMFINDWQALWRMTVSAKRLEITFPVKAGGTRTAAFEVGGLNPSKMPWPAK
jgi:hypothetical protein